MNWTLRISQPLLDAIRSDLRRPHRFATERAGFVFCRYGVVDRSQTLVLAHSFLPATDDDYVDDRRFGAVLGSSAWRRALTHALEHPVGIFHVHLHAHAGAPRPSRADLSESAAFVPDFFHVRSAFPQGTLIVSNDSLSGRVWATDEAAPRSFSKLHIVGVPLQTTKGTR